MNFVSFDIVKKVMLKEKRFIYYLRDENKKLLYKNEEPELNQETLFTDLEEIINNTSGKFLDIELPEAPKGKGRVGGDNIDTKLCYRIRLQNGAATDTGIAGAGSGLNNNNIFSLLMQQMQHNSALQLKMMEQQNEWRIKELEKKIEEKNDNRVDYVREFGETFADRIISANKLKRKVEAATPGAPIKTETAAQAGAIANETGTDKNQREKIKAGLKNLSEIDKDFVDNFHFFTEYAKASPGEYKVFIDMLKQQKKQDE